MLCVSLFMCWRNWGKASARLRRVAESEVSKDAVMLSDMQDLQYNGGYIPATPLVAQGMMPIAKMNLAAGPTSGMGGTPFPHHYISFSEEQTKDGETIQPAISGVPETGDTNTRHPLPHLPQRRYSMAEWAMQQRRDQAIDHVFVARIGYSRSNTHRTEQLCGLAPGAAPRRASTFGGLGHGP